MRSQVLESDREGDSLLDFPGSRTDRYNRNGQGSSAKECGLGRVQKWPELAAWNNNSEQRRKVARVALQRRE